jgi:hypothetical protein
VNFSHIPKFQILGCDMVYARNNHVLCKFLFGSDFFRYKEIIVAKVHVKDDDTGNETSDRSIGKRENRMK